MNITNEMSCASSGDEPLLVDTAQEVKVNDEKLIYWCFGMGAWLLLVAALALTVWAYYDGLLNLVHRWEVEEEHYNSI